MLQHSLPTERYCLPAFPYAAPYDVSHPLTCNSVLPGIPFASSCPAPHPPSPPSDLPDVHSPSDSWLWHPSPGVPPPTQPCSCGHAHVAPHLAAWKCRHHAPDHTCVPPHCSSQYASVYRCFLRHICPCPIHRHKIHIP